jgi:putative component of membrane protein insertase Oxa1/YidC/SpoIIIJ protein YidD
LAKKDYFSIQILNVMKTISILFMFIFVNAAWVYCQTENPKSIQPTFRTHLFEDYDLEKPAKRKFLSGENKSRVSQFNPLVYLAASALFIYQNVFSEQISASCMYEISCSEITKKAIEKYGLIKGIFIGLHQLSNCSKGMERDHEPQMINSSGKIKNDSNLE